MRAHSVTIIPPCALNSNMNNKEGVVGHKTNFVYIYSDINQLDDF